ncbi:OmpA family protein [Niabella yanshanensis]|uniref:OmpA family protein n=1 Tax=Niabella yanshanensis TaxID=577386 RepID=A0ABZ0W1S5_9BACT|nr:OmpA family protein [Niabella yanshanensis]WQD37146.1 OmpA family protein [Niabella yanshanensis]
MTSKKYQLLAGLSCLVASTGFAQVSPSHPYTAPHPVYGTFSVTDSNYYNSKQLAQHNEFMVGNYDYPAKPKDMWEIGIKGGSFSIPFADVDARFGRSFGFGGHIRKSLGHVMSLRLEYVYGVAQGLNWRPSTGYTAEGTNTPWAGYGGDQVYYNYKTKAQDLSLQALFNLGNIRFYKNQTGATIYALAGVGVNTYRTSVNALNGNSAYNFPGAQGTYDNRKDQLDALKDLLDDSYESQATIDPSKKWTKTFAGYITPSATVGAGIAFRLSSRVNLAIEDRLIFNGSDMLDGVRFDESRTLSPDKDVFNYLSLGLNFNLGSSAKRVEPLYWLNPLNYAYGELRRVPEIILPDADGDGVTDQFDQEQTPAGCPVDTHGVSRDTDGDGVPDCKDKELITPTYCQPVDADGVGKCPCPEGCAPAQSDCAASLGALPSIHFAANSNKLSDDAAATLATVASKLKANPNCKVVVVGYCAATKRQQQLSWDHVNKVISHLVEKEGVSSDRFIFSSGQEGGDCDAVDIRAAAPGEDGPNTIAPPHPNLRKN